jgi:hypothetical protein
VRIYTSDGGATTIVADPGSPDWVPNLRNVIFPHQSEQELSIPAVLPLFLESFGFDLRRIADPQLET